MRCFLRVVFVFSASKANESKVGHSATFVCTSAAAASFGISLKGVTYNVVH